MREYFEHEQSNKGISDYDKKLVDDAIAKLYAKIGNPEQLLNEKAKLIDYQKTVAYTVQKIVEYYEEKLKRIADKVSGEQYRVLTKAMDNLHKAKDINNWRYFKYFSYLRSYRLLNLNRHMRRVVMNFFIATRNYVESKMHDGFVPRDREERLMRMIKLVHLQINGGLFRFVKCMVLANNHFMLRREIER